MAEADIKLFLSIGLDEDQAKSNAKKKKNCSVLKQVIEELDISEPLPRTQALLLQSFAVKCPESAGENRKIVSRAIARGDISREAQVNAAIKLLKSLPLDGTISNEDVNSACGVGIEVTPEELREFFLQKLESDMDLVQKERYTYPFFKLNYAFRTDKRLQWADGKTATKQLEAVKLELLGPETEADKAMAAEAKKAKKSSKKSKGKANKAKEGKSVQQQEDAVDTSFFEARDLKAAINSKMLLAEHEDVTKGVIQTRFPPEPNGYLHIGHAKSMNLNFNYCFKKIGSQGQCTFRYDDTNPEAESKEFIDSLADNVKWLGWEPSRVTYSSNYFGQLYEYACELIRRGKAFVCHQTKLEMETCREISKKMMTMEGYSGPDVPESPYRNRSVEENLKLFEDMKHGKFAEGAAVLRMKMDMRSNNPNMWDQVAYRIKFVPHPHVGDAWCIYPSYDFTHCIVDSIEHIDLSLCTLEFETRRDTYYWLLEALDLWRPHVWEFGRLDLSYTLMSKRKLKKLVLEGYVSGWDDPRLPTLNGLRRRGYTPEAINKFCEEIGVTRIPGTVVDYQRLENAARQNLDPTAVRAMAVLDPLKVVITNYKAKDVVDTVEILNIPSDPSKGSHLVPIQHELYIDHADFRVDGAEDKNFFGLAPGKTVILKNAFRIRCNEVIMDGDMIKELHVHQVAADVIDNASDVVSNQNKKKKAKIGVLTWVASPLLGKPPRSAEIRLYEKLVTVPDAGTRKDWLEYLNKESLTVKHGYVDESVSKTVSLDHWQFERVAYFVTDLDSTPDKLIFNRVVSLKENKMKKVNKK